MACPSTQPLEQRVQRFPTARSVMTFCCLPCLRSSRLSPHPSEADLRAGLLEREDDEYSLHSNYRAHKAAAPKLSRLDLILSLFVGSRGRAPAARQDHVDDEQHDRPVKGHAPRVPTPPPEQVTLTAEEAALAQEEEREIRKARRRARRRARELGLDVEGYGQDDGSSVAETESRSSDSGKKRSKRSRRRQEAEDAQSATSAGATDISHAFTFSPHLLGQPATLYPQFAMDVDGQPILDLVTGEPLFLLDDEGNPIFGPVPPPLATMSALPAPSDAPEGIAREGMSQSDFLEALARTKGVRATQTATADPVKVAAAAQPGVSLDLQDVTTALGNMADGAQRRRRWEGADEVADRDRQVEDSD